MCGSATVTASSLLEPQGGKRGFEQRNEVYFLRVWTPKPVSPGVGVAARSEESRKTAGGLNQINLSVITCDMGLVEDDRELWENGKGNFEEPAVRAIPDPACSRVRKERSTSSANLR